MNIYNICLRYTNHFALTFLLVGAVTCAEAQEQTWTYAYDDQGQMIEENGPRTDLEDITRYTYNAQGYLLTQTNALGHSIVYNSYDAEGRPLSVTDANGITTELSFNTRGEVTETRLVHPSGDTTKDAVTGFTYDAAGQLIDIIWPNSAQVYFEYDSDQRLTAIYNSDGDRIEYTLDSAGNRTEERILESGGTLRFSVVRVYDELSRVMDVLGNNGQNQHSEYDVNSNAVAINAGLGQTTEQKFDALSRVQEVINPAQGETHYTYNSEHQVTSVTDPKGLVTHYSYSALGNLIEVISPDTGTTVHVYDSAANRIRSTDARGVVTDFQYDALNRPVEIRYPGSPEENVSYQYDDTANDSAGIGQLTGFTDSTGHTDYYYNYLGQMTNKQVTVGSVTLSLQYQYDIMGQAISITYPSGRVVRIERDSFGQPQRLLTQAATDATEQVLMESASYLPFGPMLNYTYGNGLMHQRQYDLDYRLTELQIGGSSTLLSLNYQYDVVNNITAINKPNESGNDTVYTYNALNQLTEALGQNGLFGYQYDSVGNRTERTQNGNSEAYTYDSNSHRLQTQGQMQYLYDAVGNTIDNGQYSFFYGANNRLTKVENKSSGNAVVAEYRHNALGQRVYKSIPSTSSTLDYLGMAEDEALQAEAYRQQAQDASEQSQAFLAQAETSRTQAGNLTSQAAALQEQAQVYRDQAQVHQDQADAYASSAGELSNNAADLRASIVEPPTNFWDRILNSLKRIFADAYDAIAQDLTNLAAAQLAEAQQNIADAESQEQAAQDLTVQANSLLASAESEEGEAADFESQALNYLAQAEAADAQAEEYRLLAETNPSQEALATVYLFNEAGKLMGEYDESGAALKEYIYLGSAPMALAANDQIYYYHNDHLNTPKLLTDANQNIVWSAQYAPFGKADITMNNVRQNLRFPGQYYDEETGLHYNYFRDYDPSTGRYLQSDPIGLDGGINTYAYVGGNPTGYIDPSGTTKWKAQWTVVCAGAVVVGGCWGSMKICSKCANGKKTCAYLSTNGLGLGVGTPSVASGTATFDDGVDGAPNIDNITGWYHYSSFGGGISSGSKSYTEMTVGRAVSTSVTTSSEYGLGLTGINNNDGSQITPHTKPWEEACSECDE